MATTTALPPGPSPSPDQLWRMEQEPGPVLEELRATYGNLFTLHRPDQPPRVFLSTPKHFRTILLRYDHELIGLGTTAYNDLIGPHSMLLLAGAEHRRVRQLATPPFVGTALRGHSGRIHRLITEGLHQLRGNQPQPVATMTSGITARVMVSLLFSALPDGVGERIVQATVDVLGAIHDRRTLQPGTPQRTRLDTRYRRHHDELDRQLLSEIARRRAERASGGGSLLDTLLAAPDHYSDTFIRDQLVSVLTGGTTTAANGMSMALYWLHRRPDVADRIMAELAALPPDAPASQIAALPYLSAVCAEALRLPTVTPTSAARRVVNAFSAEGYHFAEGTQIIVAIHLAHHDHTTYPDHNRFRPERFLGQPASGLRYLPFGIGSHRCLGAQLTELEMRLTLAEALRLNGFNLTGADGDLRPRSHGVNLTIPHSIRARCTR